MRRETEHALPVLLVLDHGSLTEVFIPGLDGQCWVLRPAGAKRSKRWKLFAGAAYESASEPLLFKDGLEVERITVQSILPMEGSRRHLLLMIDGEGRPGRIPKSDPDADD